MKVFNAFVLIGFGIVQIFKPKTIRYLKKGWKCKDTEPREIYII
ncbi:hypothetical protein EDD68_11661 [Melghiribacillus thermohalophilus]|uniref:DUF6199 domain-containing protein n=1 Tax=Melghiribacillus thermohalophilus TaxID=1324956 RepID=A0A4V2V156_9BACI|nr:hypothetical protein EDD68_11661 [Melghiribacillus thermohalophilus]